MNLPSSRSRPADGRSQTRAAGLGAFLNPEIRLRFPAGGTPAPQWRRTLNGQERGKIVVRASRAQADHGGL